MFIDSYHFMIESLDALIKQEVSINKLDDPRSTIVASDTDSYIFNVKSANIKEDLKHEILILIVVSLILRIQRGVYF